MRVPWIGALLFTAIAGITSVAHAQSWLPVKANSDDEVIQRTAFTLGYDERHEVPAWVAYSLRPEHLRDCVGRERNFYTDPDLRSGSATLADYRGSGYDRGHLAPAGDMKWSRQAMRESFFLSNITPQTAAMNRGPWVGLENLVRSWAKKSQETIIVTGPVLTGVTEYIGPSRVAIPHWHFKVLLVSTPQGRKAIGFLMGQMPAHRDLSLYAVSVREIESITGMDFFAHLSRAEQDNLETKFNVADWDFKATFAYSSCSGSEL